MTRFKVLVYRTGYSSREIEVEADSDSEALGVAEDVAGDYEFSENNAEYEADSAEEIKDD
jgi:hypothetical protein